MNNIPYNENGNTNLWWFLYYQSQNPLFNLIPQQDLTPADHHVNQFAPPAISSMPGSNSPQPFSYSAIVSPQALPHSNLSHISPVQNIQSPRSQQNTTGSKHSSSKQEKTSKNQQSKPIITKRTTTQNTASTPKNASMSKNREANSKSKKRPREQEKDKERQAQYRAIDAEVKELNKLIEPLDSVKDKERSNLQDTAKTLKNCREIFSVFLEEMNKLNQQKDKKIQDLESELQEEKVKRRAIAKYMINQQKSYSLKQSSDQQKDKKIQDLESELQEEKVKRRAIAKYMLDHKSICLLEELQNFVPQQNQENPSILDQQSSIIMDPLDHFIQHLLDQTTLDELTSGSLDLSKP